MKRFYTLFVILFTLSTLIHIGHTQDRDPEIVPDTDVDPPSVSITAPSAVQNGAFSLTITFTEAVSDFVQADLSLSGTATANITNWNANTENTVYTATITPTTSGTVILNVAANVAIDAADNPNTAAETKTVTVDVDRPTVTIGVPSGTQTGAFEVTITFSETVSGFTQSDVALTGAAASITTWSANNNIIGVKEAVSDFVQADPSVTAVTQTVYTATITPTTSGTVTINVAANVATDAANNPNTAAETKTVTVDVDRPTVTIDVPSGTQTGAFEATITFSETVSGFTQSDVALTGAAASITTWSANTDKTVYTATITPTTSGTVILNVAANVATNAANKPNTAATAKTVNVDVDKPTVAIDVPSGTQTGAFEVTITFSETVSGFTQSDVALTGAAASITTWSANNNIIGFVQADPSLSNTVTVVTQTVCTATITPTASGTVTINVAANVATDAANNPNTAATAKTVTVSLNTRPPRDTTAPSVSITAPSAVQNGAFSATITFTEVVSDFVQADLSLTGTATASITAWNTTDNITYTATVTPATSGTVILNVAANVATDAANNPNTAATAKTVNVDVDRPTVTIGVPSGTQTGAFTATITFSKTVSGFAQSDVSLTGSAASITAWSANNDKTVYIATITPTASGTVTISVAADVANDAANNPNTAATAKTVTVSLDTTPPRDTNAPSVSISAPSDVQNGAFSVTITFTEAVSGFTQSDLSLSGTATASIMAWNTADNTTYTATITPTTSGTVIFNIEAGVATDAADNHNTAATAKTVTVDVDAPSVSISVPSAAQNGAFDTTITFTEAVSGFEQADVRLSGTETATITAWNTADNITYTATITPTTSRTVTLNINAEAATDATITPTASGTVTINVAANVAKDAANNLNTAAIAKTVDVDTTSPRMSFSFDLKERFATPLSYITNGPFISTITFTEPVTGFEQSDFEVDQDYTLTDFKAIDPETIDAKTYADTYTVKVIPDPNDTYLYISFYFPSGVATDAAGNPSDSINSSYVHVEKVRPKVAISVPDSTVETATFTIEITFDLGRRDDRPLGFEQSEVSLTNNTAEATITKWTEKQKSFRSSIHGTFQGGYGVFEAEITVTQSGSVTFGVPENVATDLAGNGNTAAIQKTVTITLTNNQGDAPFANGHITDSPSETLLLSNYPNPSNPETWIPYHLAHASNVSITIYNTRGTVVRRLVLGHQREGYYVSQSRAAHWDGTNDVGERVATGIYFYTLTAGDFSATQKLLILK